MIARSYCDETLQNSRRQTVGGLCDFCHGRQASLRPGFHYTANATTTTHKQRDIRLSSHPSRKSHCFDSKLVIVVVVIGLMETRLNQSSRAILERHTEKWKCEGQLDHVIMNNHMMCETDRLKSRKPHFNGGPSDVEPTLDTV